MPFFEAALETNSQIAQFWLSYIDALIKLDQIDAAKNVFEQSKKQVKNKDSIGQIEKRFGQLDASNEKVQDPPLTS